MAYWAKKYVTNLTRAAHWMTYYWGPHTEWLEEQLHQKCQIQDYHNKDRLSVAGYFYYSKNLNWVAQNLRLGRGLDIAALVYVAIYPCHRWLSDTDGYFIQFKNNRWRDMGGHWSRAPYIEDNSVELQNQPAGFVKRWHVCRVSKCE